jgi:hypothetical protein
MNTNGTSTSCTNARSTRDHTRGTDPHTLRREGDRFERLLREKSAPPEEDDETPPDVPVAEGAHAVPMSAFGPALQGHAQQAAVVRAGAAASDTASATQAALGSAMASHAPQQPQAGGADAHTFQVSINEPMGLPMELRAVRVPAAGNVQAPALWALNIAVPSRDAAQLARHGSRLDERLRARGVDPAHVRVDDRTDQEEPS